MENNLLHDIDKRLAVLEALSTQHAADTALQLDDLQDDLEKIKKEVTGLKVRVAAISGSISIIIGIAFKFWMF